MAGCSKEIKALFKDKAQSEQAAVEANLEMTKIKHKLEQWDKNAKDAKKNMEALVAAHAWITREKKFFGVKDSDFDFESPGKDVEECKKRLKLLKSEQDKLSKKINKKVCNGHDVFSHFAPPYHPSYILFSLPLITLITELFRITFNVSGVLF